MASLPRAFWHEARGEYGRLPVWLPGSSMALGDVGTFDPDTGWVKNTTLDKLGIRFETEGPTGDVDYDYCSHDGAEVSLRVAADGDRTFAGVVAGNAELRVHFSRRGAFLLKAQQVAIERIPDTAELDRRILECYQRDTWQRNWVVVTEVARGGPATIATSASDDAEFTLDLGTGAAINGSALFGLNAGARVAHTRGLAASFLTTGRMALLWRGRCVHDRWWQAAHVRERGDEYRAAGREELGEQAPDDEALVEEIEYPEDLPWLAT